MDFNAIMIIGDTMGNKVSLLDMNFKNFSIEEKRAAFVLMDMMMKRLHERNLMITDFNPSQIYFQDGIYSFEKVDSINDYYSDNKENAILRNILGLSNLAFCSYLPDYKLEQGLLSYEMVHQNFNNFASYFSEEDRDYYKSIFIDCYDSKKLPSDIVYYSDYVVKQHRNSANRNTTSLAYIKATEAGRAFARQDDNEAAFGRTFFFLTMVASLTIALVGIAFYFYSYLG